MSKGEIVGLTGIAFFLVGGFVSLSQIDSPNHNAPWYSGEDMPWGIIIGGLIGLACYIYALHDATRR